MDLLILFFMNIINKEIGQSFPKSESQLYLGASFLAYF